MRGKIKPLLIEMRSFDKDIGNVIQIARAEAHKVLKCQKVKILDIIKYPPYGYIVMVLNREQGVQTPRVSGIRKEVNEKTI